MNTRTRNLTVATGGVFLALLLMLGKAQPASVPRAAPPHGIGPTTTPVPPAPPGEPGVGGSQAERARRGTHTYAVDVSWLKGFPPDASPGDVFHIWVAWDRSVIEGPNIQLLLTNVELEKVAPPVTPQGPYVAFLFMSRQQARDFLYGKEYGSLSVTQPAG